MPRLNSRQRQIPNGFLFYIPPLKWRSSPFASFDTIVTGAITVLKANPHVAQQLGWDLSYDAMANRVDEMNAVLCEKMGWTEYISSGSPGGAAATPFIPPSSPTVGSQLERSVAVVKKLASGAAALLEWEEAGMPHVSAEIAASRAAVCAGCPKNQQGKSLTEYFTSTVADLFNKRFQRLQEQNLTTPRDEALNVCEACLCPMRTKVWFPNELVLKRLKAEQRPELQQQNPRCWILDIT